MASTSVSSHCSNSQTDFNVQDVEHDAILMEFESQSADIASQQAITDLMEKVKTATPYGEQLCQAFQEVSDIMGEPATVKDIELLNSAVITKNNNESLWETIQNLTHEYELDLMGGEWPSITLSLKSDAVFIATLKAFEK